MFEISEAQSACIIMNTKRCKGRNGYIFSKFLTSFLALHGCVAECQDQSLRSHSKETR